VKQQVNLRVSDATREKLDFLSNRYGTQTEAIAVAIENLYLQEKERMSHKLNVPDYASSTDTYITTCSCGARWRCTYTDKGLQWTPLNAQAKQCPHGK
jgi:predicted DNA-binding protein